MAFGLASDTRFTMKQATRHLMRCRWREQGLALPTVLALSMVSGVLLLACCAALPALLGCRRGDGAVPLLPALQDPAGGRGAGL